MYSVGWLVAYLAVLFLVAEPLRNTGKYTMADLISFRLRGRGVRAIAAVSTIAITLFYLIAQMVGISALVNVLLPRFGDVAAIVVVGVLMLVYVLFGGMLATTWVQIIKAVLLLFTSIGLSLLGDGALPLLVRRLSQRRGDVPVGGGRRPTCCSRDCSSTARSARGTSSRSGSRWCSGTAGLPHILMRFFTVSSAKAARTSVAWAMVLIGIFYLTTSFMGLGAATIVGKEHIGRAHVRRAGDRVHRPSSGAASSSSTRSSRATATWCPSPTATWRRRCSPATSAARCLTAFVAAVAFATILAVVAGLTLAASSAFAHDIWFSLVRNGRGDETEYLFVARATAARRRRARRRALDRAARVITSPSSSGSRSQLPRAPTCR